MSTAKNLWAANMAFSVPGGRVAHTPHEVDEDILEAGIDLTRGDAGAPPDRLDGALERGPVAAAHVQRVAERRDHLDSGHRAQLRLGDGARGEGETLLPAARERPRELALARRQARALERARHTALAFGNAIHACDEVEVLLDRQVLVETELLRHVADFALDELG